MLYDLGFIIGTDIAMFSHSYQGCTLQRYMEKHSVKSDTSAFQLVGLHTSALFVKNCGVCMCLFLCVCSCVYEDTSCSKICVMYMSTWLSFSAVVSISCDGSQQTYHVRAGYVRPLLQ